MGRIRQTYQYITKSRFVRSIFYQITSVFLIVIFLLVAVVSYSFRSEINKSTVADTKEQLDGIEDAISSRLEEVMSIAYNIGQDTMFFLEPVAGIRYTGYEMANALARYLVGNRFIEYLAYYRLSEPDRIYTSSGELSFHRFWDAYLHCDNYTEETYLELIKNNTGVRLIPLSSSEQDTFYFTYVCPLPQFSTRPRAFAIAIIPRDAISSVLASQIANSHGEIALFDAGGNLIYRARTLSEDIALAPSDTRDAYTQSYITQNGKRYVVQQKVSEVNGWTYVSAVRLDDIVSGLAGPQTLVILVLVILMLVAVCVILTGIVNRYGPIRDLALTLNDQAAPNDDDVIDEKRLLSNTIATLKHNSAQRQMLEAAYQEATEASRAKTAFLSNMSHDIRTPMNAIIGMTGIALKHADDADYVRACLGKVQVASRYLLDIINNVLDMSRIESGKIALNEDVVDLAEMIRGVITIIQPNVAEKRQRLTVDTEQINNTKVIGDNVRMTQVCMNILSNAVKFTPEGGEIHMRVAQTAPEEAGFGRYVFVIRDTGIGMSADFVGRVFETFSRAADSAVSKVEGTGLGMSIAKNLVEMMGGTIVCESEPGTGTTFTVTLRLRLADGALAQAPVAGAHPPSLPGKRVLLVEDNAINREIAGSMIAETRAEYIEAVNGREAVDAFAAHAQGYFDVILMDLQMPVMDGYQAAAAIRAMPRADAATIPIYAMTANTFDEDVRRVREAGMNGHLGKPYTPQELFEILERAIASKDERA